MRKEVRRIPHQVGPTSDKRHDLDSRRDHPADRIPPSSVVHPPRALSLVFLPLVPRTSKDMVEQRPKREQRVDQGLYTGINILESAASKSC